VSPRYSFSCFHRPLFSGDPAIFPLVPLGRRRWRPIPLDCFSPPVPQLLDHLPSPSRSVCTPSLILFFSTLHHTPSPLPFAPLPFRFKHPSPRWSRFCPSTLLPPCRLCDGSPQSRVKVPHLLTGIFFLMADGNEVPLRLLFAILGRFPTGFLIFLLLACHIRNYYKILPRVFSFHSPRLPSPPPSSRDPRFSPFPLPFPSVFRKQLSRLSQVLCCFFWLG